MRSVVLVVLAACGGGHATPDATVDAPIDALIDAPAPPAGAHRYVIDRENVPTTNTQARDFGLDLDADGAVDNQLGMVMSTFVGMGFDMQGQTDHAVDTGQILMLGDLDAADLTTATTATFTTFVGTNAMPAACAGSTDTVCRHHLAGTATFDVATGSPRDTPLPGTIASSLLTGGPGHLVVQFVAIFGAPVTIDLIGARVKLGMLADGTIGDSILAGAVSQTDIDGKIIPGIQQGAMAVITRDCTMLTSPPGCGCADGSDGKTAAGLFDTSPKDCMVSVDEIRNNSLIQALLAPDVMLEGQMALSLGVQVTAVHAAFTP